MKKIITSFLAILTISSSLHAEPNNRVSISHQSIEDAVSRNMAELDLQLTKTVYLSTYVGSYKYDGFDEKTNTYGLGLNWYLDSGSNFYLEYSKWKDKFFANNEELWGTYSYSGSEFELDFNLMHRKLNLTGYSGQDYSIISGYDDSWTGLGLEFNYMLTNNSRLKLGFMVYDVSRVPLVGSIQETIDYLDLSLTSGLLDKQHTMEYLYFFDSKEHFIGINLDNYNFTYTEGNALLTSVFYQRPLSKNINVEVELGKVTHSQSSNTNFVQFAVSYIW